MKPHETISSVSNIPGMVPIFLFFTPVNLLMRCPPNIGNANGLETYQALATEQFSALHLLPSDSVTEDDDRYVPRPCCVQLSPSCIGRTLFHTSSTSVVLWVHSCFLPPLHACFSCACMKSQTCTKISTPCPFPKASHRDSGLNVALPDPIGFLINQLYRDSSHLIYINSLGKQGIGLLDLDTIWVMTTTFSSVVCGNNCCLDRDPPSNYFHFIYVSLEVCYHLVGFINMQVGGRGLGGD